MANPARKSDLEAVGGLCLTGTEVRHLTRRRRASAQIRELEAMRIPYRRRRRGPPAVLRVHVETMIGAPRPAATLPEEPELDLDAL